MFRQKHKSYKLVLHVKNLVDWINTRREKVSQPKNVRFEKKARKLKKHVIFYFMITFYNFALKIETSWTKGMVKPISETRIPNATVSLVYSFLDNFFSKTCSVKKNSNVENLQQKTKIDHMESKTRITTQHSSINYPNNQNNHLVTFLIFIKIIWLSKFQVTGSRWEDLILNK